MHEYERLAVLGEQLSMRGVTTCHQLRVSLPEAVDTITCRPRPEDGDRLWFFLSSGEPLAEAAYEHLDDAVLHVVSHLHQFAQMPPEVS